MNLLLALMLVRVATYNVHSCRGLDFRMSPERIANVVAHTGAAIVALEEVRSEQADAIAARLGFHHVFGLADVLDGHLFGNAILSRYPIAFSRNYPLGVPGREQRACLRADIEWPVPGMVLHVFAVHLGLNGAERRQQAARIASPEILANVDLSGPRILLGDLNEWRHGAVDRTFRALLERRPKRTWPGLLPLIPFDRIYYERRLAARSLRLRRSCRALIASDHVPLVGEFTLLKASP
jgi:endonuclease/exonuclease/phosphatase family metal-dependent hydrolase